MVSHDDWGRLVLQLVRELHEEPFQPRYRGRSAGRPVAGLQARLRSYFWPTPEQGLAATSTLMAPWFEEPGALSWRLVEHGAWGGEEGSRAEALAWHMLQWERATRQPVFSVALPTGHLEVDPERAPHVIWDSRASTPLVFPLDEFMAGREGLDSKTIFPRIGIVPGRGGSRKVGGARHPSRLRLRCSHA